MLYTGLVSITFRKLQPRDIIKLVRQAGLHGIEWGGDVHVPHGNLHRAREVAMLTRDAGLHVAAYGSYYRCGEPSPLRFESVLETARLLGAPVIRVWAGGRSPDAADDVYWASVMADARRAAGLAAKAGIQVAFESHSGTLTETNDSAERLIGELNATVAASVPPPIANPQSTIQNSMGTYWQPPVGSSIEVQEDGLRRLLPWLVHVHVSNVATIGYSVLEDRVAEWCHLLPILRSTGRDHHLLIEFVKGDMPESFAADAATLRRMLAETA